MTVDRQLLLEILSWARPHKSETEKRFAREFLDTIPGMEKDGFGNRFLTVGADPRVLWSSHIDTVAKQGGPQLLDFDTRSGIVSLAAGKAGMSLGADDGAGVWIMLEMIRAARPGLYVFHRGEELGCLGSQHILRHTPELLTGIDAAIAFDRRGTDSIITHQMSGMTASDDFAASMSDALRALDPKLRMKADDGGVYTDTDTYSGLIPECSNLGVGYEGNHGPRETLDVHHAERLLEAMLQLDTAELVIAREAGDCGWEMPAKWSSYSPTTTARENAAFGDWEEMLEAVRRHPEAAAELLLGCLVTPREVAERAAELDQEAEGDPSVDPWLREVCWN